MMNVDEFLLRWHDGTLREAEVRELTAWLNEPANRTRLVEEAFLDEAILEAFKVERVVALPAEIPASVSKVKNILQLSHCHVFWATFGKLAACLALLTAVVWYLIKPEQIRARISGSGPVVVQRGKQILSPKDTLSLRAGDIIKTSAGGKATLKYQEETTSLELKENTELKLSKEKKGKRFELARGKVEAMVAKQPEGRPMVLVTPQAQAKVVGTKFTLDARRASTWLEVTEGAVKLARKTDGQAVKVARGQFAVAARGADLIARPVTKEINPGRPLPLGISLFSDMDLSGTWWVSPEFIRQTDAELVYGERKFQLKPPVDCNVVIETTSSIESVGVTAQRWGCEMMANFTDRVVLRAKLSQGNESRARLQLEMSDLKTLKILQGQDFPVPFVLGKRPVFWKFQFERLPAKEVWLRVKVWDKGLEPAVWSAEMLTDLPPNQSLTRISLATRYTRSVFTEFRVSLLE